MDGFDEFGAAEQIGVSVHTIHTYVRRMFRAVNVNSRSEFLSRLFAACLKEVTGRAPCQEQILDHALPAAKTASS